MTLSTTYILLAVIAFALIPIVPQIMRLRIRVLRWLHWRWMADLHQNHFVAFVLAARLILAVVGAALLVLGFAGLNQ